MDNMVSFSVRRSKVFGPLEFGVFEVMQEHTYVAFGMSGLFHTRFPTLCLEAILYPWMHLTELLCRWRMRDSFKTLQD